MLFRLLFTGFIVLAFSHTLAAQHALDTLYLLDGNVRVGTVTELKGRGRLAVRLPDSTERTYPVRVFDKVIYSNGDVGLNRNGKFFVYPAQLFGRQLSYRRGKVYLNGQRLRGRYQWAVFSRVPSAERHFQISRTANVFEYVLGIPGGFIAGLVVGAALNPNLEVTSRGYTIGLVGVVVGTAPIPVRKAQLRKAVVAYNAAVRAAGGS